MDSRLRDLERAALSGGIPEKAAFLHALVHAGIYTSKEVEAMAWLDLPAAKLLFPSLKKLSTGGEKKTRDRNLFRVDEFVSEFLQRTQPTWVDLEDQVIDRLSRRRGVELAFVLFEKFLLPRTFSLDETLGTNVGQAVTNYLNAAKRYQGLTQTGPVLFKHQFQAIRMALMYGVRDTFAGTPVQLRARDIEREIVTSLQLDHKNYMPRRIFYFVVHAIARIGDLEISYPELRQPDSRRYKQLVVQTVKDFLIPLAAQ